MSYEPPEVKADGTGAGPSFKLPKTHMPEPVLPGVRGHRTSEGYLVLRVHYTCDPERADEEWRQEQVQGYRGGFEGSDWQREMEIDFGSFAGEPIYPRFDPNKSIKRVKYNSTLPLWRGWDFGYRNPAVTFWQLWPDDTLVLLHELFPTEDKEALPGISTADLARLVIQETERLFPGASDQNNTAGVFDFCDPAGTQTKETSDMSSVETLQTFGILPEYSVVGRKTRIAYLRNYVEGVHENGEAKLLISPHCALSIRAFSKGYRRPEEGKGTSDPDMPDLSRKVQSEPYIHLMDSAEYMAACNLQIEHPTPTSKRKEEEDTKIGDLAEMYLGAVSEAPSRVASGAPRNIAEDAGFETILSDLVGEESLDDAWRIT